MEYEWLTGNSIISDEELNLGVSFLSKKKAAFQNGDLCYWIKKARNIIIDPLSSCEPYQLLNEGKIKEAAHFWETHDCPFEKAITLTEGDANDRKEGLGILHQLGATAVYEKIKSMMRAEGIKKIPRGVRNSTRNNPAQLTNRELDVLSLLPEGIANKEIASTLFISPKTVDHHISSLFFKLNVNTRAKAVVKARCLGILK
jgi:DNA-binding CsgD family transcriptional regulator